ncbi:hypothetical protein, partial [Escherichia coli]|uniref:hypothetical protein n=1 Tax=Escherichia coli TaxID=562 RepID=UPI00200FDFCC
MSDRDLRSAERAALTGDPDSQARLDAERWRRMTTYERLWDRLRDAPGKSEGFIRNTLMLGQTQGWDAETTLVKMVGLLAVGLHES